MRTVLLANNRLGGEIGRFLLERRELDGVVLHPKTRRKQISVLEAADVRLWEWPDGFEEIRRLEPECLLSVLFGYRLSPAWLELPTWRAINLHPGCLPWNAGCHPNVWPLVDGSPAGTTLHVMEPQIDSGAIIAQERILTYPDDTALTLANRLHGASLAMFRRVWPTVRAMEPVAQVGEGSYHGLDELAHLDLAAEELKVLDHLRARTFTPHGAEFEREGGRYRVRVEIEHIDDLGRADILALRDETGESGP